MSKDGLQGRYGMVSEVIGILEIELQIIHQAAKWLSTKVFLTDGNFLSTKKHTVTLNLVSRSASKLSFIESEIFEEIKRLSQKLCLLGLKNKENVKTNIYVQLKMYILIFTWLIY